MWVEDGITNLHLEASVSLTIGAFDGVHLGHQALIRAMVVSSHSTGVQAVVLTFNPLPRQVLGRSTAGLLSSLNERLAMFETLRLDGTVVIPFTQEFADTPAAHFVGMLARRFTLTTLWAGPDFRVGRHQEGDIAFLRAEGARYGFQVRTLDEPVLWQGTPVRSSRIRQALSRGHLEEANGCLGRPYAMTGTVGHGDQRGRLLGFPTANLILPADKLLPSNGVYVCRAFARAETFDALVSVGTRPTFDNGRPTVEAYLLDFSGDLYGQTMQLDYLHRLRTEIRFPSADALIAQMQQDEANGRAWLHAWRTSKEAHTAP